MIKRYFSHDEEGKPIMVLHRQDKPQTRGVIQLRDAWLYSEDHNPGFEKQIMAVAKAAYEYFGSDDLLTLSRKSRARRMAEIADVIEGGIDELLSMPPRDPDRGRVVTEGMATINNEHLPFEMTDKGYVNA